MITNFVDAFARNLCRGLNGVLGFYPTTCLTNAGRPTLYLAIVAVGLVVVIVVSLRKRRS